MMAAVSRSRDGVGMAILESIAKQLHKPSGFIGKFVVARLLNRGNAPLNLLTLKCLALQSDDRVLEIGFGGGDLLNRIAERVAQGHVTGVDFSPEMVALCERRFARLIAAKRMELHCASVEKLPLPEAHFTKVCTVNTIYFWPAPMGPLKEIHRVMADGGRLVVCFNPPATLKKAPYTKYGFHFREPAEVQGFLAEAGFHHLEMVDGVSSLGEFKCAVATK